MRLHSFPLPKLAVIVNLVCLFMIFKLACCIRLYNDCSSQNIAVDRKGRVYARDNPSQLYQNFTIKSKDFTGKLAIFGEESRRYLCFNKKWRLIGSKKFRTYFCTFREEMLDNGYTRYRTANSDGNETRYIGFSKDGKIMKETRLSKVPQTLQKCLYFLKLDTNVDLNDHNRKVAGLKDDIDITAKLQHLRLQNSNITSQNDVPYAYRHSANHKLRHKNHHHQNINDIT